MGFLVCPNEDLISADYIKAFFNVINWEEVNKRYQAAL